MIKSLTITNHVNEKLKLVLADPDASGFIVKSIDGLGPVKANVNFTELATNDGAIDNSARLQSRNIVLSLRFLPNPTIEDTRLLTYKFFPVKRNITILIETDNRICKATGRVESNEPDIFSNEEGCQISILCPSPYFYSVDARNKIVLNGVKPLFSFPFSNESLTEPLIPVGLLENKMDSTVFYDGDAEVGVYISAHARDIVRNLAIYNTGTREMMKLNHEKLVRILGEGIKAGDDIIIDTNKGSKKVYIYREGIYHNVLNALEKPMQWLYLTKGYNTFAYTADLGSSNLTITIEYDIVYEGV